MLMTLTEAAAWVVPATNATVSVTTDTMNLIGQSWTLQCQRRSLGMFGLDVGREAFLSDLTEAGWASRFVHSERS